MLLSSASPVEVVQVAIPEDAPGVEAGTKAMAAWAKEKIKGTWFSPALGADVEVTSYGINHSAHQSRRQPSKMMAITALPQMIEAGRVLRAADGDITQLYAVAILDGSPQVARITVEQRKQDQRGPWNRFYDLKGIEIKDAPAVLSAVPSEDGGILAEPGRKITLGDLQDIVKNVEERGDFLSASAGPRVGRLDVPDAVILHGLGATADHRAYKAAKSGNPRAALALARDLVTSDAVESIKQQIGDSKPIVVPVLAIEESGRNMIPLGVAKMLKSSLGLDTHEDIIQSVKANRGGKSALDRVFAQSAFDGPVTAGADYLLVDDTLTQGGTFAALAAHIQANGGRVVGVVALTGKQYSAKLRLSDELLVEIRDKFGDVESDFRRATGYGFDSLTESEARALVRLRPADAIRSRILAEGNEEGGPVDGEGTGEGPSLRVSVPPDPTQTADPVANYPGAGLPPQFLGSSSYRPAATLAEAREAAREFVGKPITNLDDGMVAKVTGNTLRKMANEKAVNKSVSPRIHALAVANLDRLFTNAAQSHHRPSIKDDRNIKSIHRYAAPFMADGEIHLAWMTVKSFRAENQGNTIYSVEALDVVKPAGQSVSGLRDEPRSTPLTGFEEKLQRKIDEIKGNKMLGNCFFTFGENTPRTPLQEGEKGVTGEKGKIG